MIKMEKGELTMQGALSEIVMDWLCIGKMIREDVLAEKLGGSDAIDDIFRDMTDTVINHGKTLTGAELNLGTAIAVAEVVATVAKFARLEDEEVDHEADQL